MKFQELKIGDAFTAKRIAVGAPRRGIKISEGDAFILTGADAMSVASISKNALIIKTGRVAIGYQSSPAYVY